MKRMQAAKQRRFESRLESAGKNIRALLRDGSDDAARALTNSVKTDKYAARYVVRHHDVAAHGFGVNVTVDMKGAEYPGVPVIAITPLAVLAVIHSTDAARDVLKRPDIYSMDDSFGLSVAHYALEKIDNEEKSRYKKAKTILQLGIAGTASGLGMLLFHVGYGFVVGGVSSTASFYSSRHHSRRMKAMIGDVQDFNKQRNLAREKTRRAEQMREKREFN